MLRATDALPSVPAGREPAGGGHLRRRRPLPERRQRRRRDQLGGHLGLRGLAQHRWRGGHPRAGAPGRTAGGGLPGPEWVHRRRALEAGRGRQCARVPRLDLERRQRRLGLPRLSEQPAVVFTVRWKLGLRRLLHGAGSRGGAALSLPPGVRRLPWQCHAAGRHRWRSDDARLLRRARQLPVSVRRPLRRGGRTDQQPSAGGRSKRAHRAGRAALLRGRKRARRELGERRRIAAVLSGGGRRHVQRRLRRGSGTAGGDLRDQERRSERQAGDGGAGRRGRVVRLADQRHDVSGWDAGLGGGAPGRQLPGGRHQRSRLLLRTGSFRHDQSPSRPGPGGLWPGRCGRRRRRLSRPAPARQGGVADRVWL